MLGTDNVNPARVKMVSFFHGFLPPGPLSSSGPGPYRHSHMRLRRAFGADVAKPDTLQVCATARLVFLERPPSPSFTAYGTDHQPRSPNSSSCTRPRACPQPAQPFPRRHRNYPRRSIPHATHPLIADENSWLGSDRPHRSDMSIGALYPVVLIQPASMVGAGHTCRPPRPITETR